MKGKFYICFFMFLLNLSCIPCYLQLVRNFKLQKPLFTWTQCVIFANLVMIGQAVLLRYGDLFLWLSSAILHFILEFLTACIVEMPNLSLHT